MSIAEEGKGGLTTCLHCQGTVIRGIDGTCPECGKLASTAESAPDEPPATLQQTAASTGSMTGSSSASVIGALVAGLVSAKLSGSAVYLLAAAVTLDPRGSGLVVGQVLFYFVRAVGGYVAGRVLRRYELGLAVGLAVVDIGSMMGLMFMIRAFGFGTDELRNAAATAKPVEYAYELVAAIPGYAMGGLLALVQRRYLGARTAGPRAVSPLSRQMFRLFGGALYLAGTLMCVGAFGVLMFASGAKGPPLFSLTFLILMITTAIAGLLGSMAVAAGKSFMAAAAPPLVGVPEVVILRSFRDDTIAFDPKNMLSRQFLPNIDHSLEEILVRAARSVGRSGAIGDPTEELPKPGAARTYFEADDNVRWREQATAYIDGCKVLIVLLGSSKGLSWEYGQIAVRRALPRTILVVPPHGGGDGWPIFREAITAEGVTNLPEQLPSDALLVRFDGGGQPRVYRCGSRDPDSYAPKLQQALGDMAAGRDTSGDVTQPSPIRLVTVVGIILMGGLWAVYGGIVGFLALALMTGGKPDAFGNLVTALIPCLGGAVGLALGVRQGSKIKRFS
jgi:hypothetical protein